MLFELLGHGVVAQLNTWIQCYASHAQGRSKPTHKVAASLTKVAALRTSSRHWSRVATYVAPRECFRQCAVREVEETRRQKSARDLGRTSRLATLIAVREVTSVFSAVLRGFSN